MGKRHPSDLERHQAARLFTLLKERMPSWKLKRNVRWKGQEEGRILLIVTPGDTFSPDPRKNESYALKRDSQYKGKTFTDYGLRMNILVPSPSHPHFDVDLEIVGLEARPKNPDHGVHKVTPTQFVAQTGCSYGFELAKKSLQISQDVEPSEVISEARMFLKREFDEITTLLVFDHFARPDSMLSSKKEIDSFVQELLNDGLKMEEVPAWLKMPFRVDEGGHPANPTGLYFDTTFEGIRASGGSSRMMHFQHEVMLRGTVRMRIKNGKLLIKVGAKPTSHFDFLKEFSSDLKERTRVISKVTSKEGLCRLILELMEEVVFDVYRRSQGWSRPVIWKQV